MKTLQFWLWLTLIGSVGSTIFGLVTPLFYRTFFNDLVTTGSKALVEPTLRHIILIVLVLNFISWLFNRFGQIGIDRFTAKGSAKLKQDAFSYLINHSYTFFANNFTGSLTQRIGRYSRAYERLTDRVLWNVIPLGVRIIGTIAILYTINREISIIVMVWMIIFLTFNYFYARFKLKYDLQKSEADTKASAVLADAITNHNTIQLFTGQERERGTFFDITSIQSRLTIFVNNLAGAADAFQALLMVFMEFILFYFSIPLWAAGEINLGTFVLFESYILGLGYNMWDFSRVIRDFYEGFSDAKEMVEILELQHEIKDIPGATDLKMKSGEVEFKDVAFSFNESRQVLKGINLDIKGGEKVALIGPSGAGKSTFVRLLLRLYEINKGAILVDGQDIKNVTQESLHHYISLVPQDPILFHRTLMENIRYGRPEATDSEVIEAAKLAHCDEFIDNLPKKYDTFVGERGIKLSGGERQRVAIARAILKNAPILILDEATSSLDSHSEALIQDALEKLMSGKTTIVIAHRLSTIRKMDRIVVVQDGAILEEGTHEELLVKEGSLYKKLWELQAGGFIVQEGDKDIEDKPQNEGEGDEDED